MSRIPGTDAGRSCPLGRTAGAVVDLRDDVQVQEVRLRQVLGIDRAVIGHDAEALGETLP